MEFNKELLNACCKQIKEMHNTSTCSVIDFLYVIVKNDNSVVSSQYEPILDATKDIKYVFTFPRISYTPMTNWYVSFLSPLIIDINDNIYDNILKEDDWTFEITGQFLGERPRSISSTITNKKLGINIDHYQEARDFPTICSLYGKYKQCKTNNEAKYIQELYYKDCKIESITTENLTLKNDLNIKDKTIEGYKELLNRIDLMVSTK